MPIVDRNAATANPAAAASPACRPAPRTAIGTISFTHDHDHRAGGDGLDDGDEIGFGGLQHRVPASPATKPTTTMAANRSSTLRSSMPPASSAAATPMASGRLERNTAPTSATDTCPPPSNVSPMAIDSGMPSSTMPTVRLRAAVASAPAGQRFVARAVLGVLDWLFGILPFGARRSSQV